MVLFAVTVGILLSGCKDEEMEFQLKDDISRTTEESAETEKKEEEQEDGFSGEVSGSSIDPAIAQKEEEKSASGEIIVYVCGAVAQPGVYCLPVGSRVVQAVEAAGGLLPEAEERALNQARILEDGEQITVPTQEETKQAGKDFVSENSGRTSAGSCTTEGESKSGKVNLNTATKEELMTISGIGESRADAILSYRAQNGPFREIEEIKNIDGIKDKLFEKIRGFIEV